MEEEEELGLLGASSFMVSSSNSSSDASSDQVLELKEKLERYQEQLRSLKAELLYRTDRLNELQQRAHDVRTEKEESLLQEKLKPDLFRRRVITEKEKAEQYERMVASLSSQMLDQIQRFLGSQVMPVAAQVVGEEKKQDDGENKNLRQSAMYEIGGSADFFQVEVCAEKQVCSLKVDTSCTFSELMTHVCQFWSIPQNVQKHLMFVDNDGAAFLDHMNVKRTMNRFTGTTNQILLRQRPEVSSQDLEKFDPFSIAERVRRATELRPTLYSMLKTRHIDAKRRKGLELNSSPDIEQGGLAEDQPFLEQRGDQDSSGDEDDDDNEDDGPIGSSGTNNKNAIVEPLLRTTKNHDGTGTGADHNNHDNGDDDDQSVSSIEDFVDEFLEDLFSSEALMDGPAATDKQVSQKEFLLERKEYTYFLVLDCMVFMPLFVILGVIFIVGFQRYLVFSDIQIVQRQYRRYFELFVPALYIGNEVSSEFLTSGAESLDIAPVPFDLVSNDRRLYYWLENTFPKLLFSNITCAPGDPCFIMEYHLLVSQVRLRQQRVEDEVCKYVELTSCFGPYTEKTRSETPIPQSTSNLPPFLGNPFKFIEGSDDILNWTNTCPFGVRQDLEAIARYDPSGFYVVGTNSREQFVEMIQGLRETTWLDEKTRSISVEFNTININTGVSMNHLFLFQKSESGTYIPIYSPRPYPPVVFKEITTKGISFAIAAVIVLALIIVMHITFLFVFMQPDQKAIMADQESLQQQLNNDYGGKSTKKCCRGCCTNKKINTRMYSKWNIIDIFVVLLSLVVIILEAYIVESSRIALSINRSRDVSNTAPEDLPPFPNTDSFFNTRSYSDIVKAQQNIAGTIVFLCFARMARVLALGQRGEVLFRAINLALKRISGIFIMIYIPLFLALVSLVYVVYGSKAPTFSSFGETLFWVVRLEVGFVLPGSWETDAGWQTFIGIIFLLLIVYFASVILLLYVIDSYSIASLQASKTTIQGFTDWYKCVTTLHNGPSGRKRNQF